MIEKIIEISNLGHFVNFKFHGSKSWNGQLKKLNIIYAPNGSGKTTLSTILKSLSQNDLDLVRLKKTFGVEDDPKVIIKEYNSGNLITLGETSWSSNNLKIEVFDINYVEEYLFAGSYVRKQNKTNLFKLLLGQKGLQFRNMMKPIINKKERLIKNRSVSKKDVSFIASVKECQDELDKMMKDFDEYSSPIFDKHIQIVNKYLSKFTSYITLLEFSYLQHASDFEIFRIFPVFEVYDEKVAFSTPDYRNKIRDARCSMSEGDKSTIALCFFLARLEILGVSDKIVVFDDPLSSFDYSRRNATTFQLSKIANAAVQFILLTHDLAFADDFSDKCSFLENITMKIENNGLTSSLGYFNIKSEFLTSVQKDIEVIKNFIASGAKTDNDKREVIRCIRPVLEGVFKSKYFDLIQNNIWLGEIIEIIRSSNKKSRLYRLNEIIEDVIELNDYTKSYHHSTGNNKDKPIDSEELKRYVKNLMLIIDKI